MSPDVFLFWFLSLVVLVSGVSVVALSNPIYSALSLAMTMVSVAALFVTLQAHFLAGVQLIVYAGAVMVLFVMVLMLFDIKQEVRLGSSMQMGSIFKLISVAGVSGLVIGSVIYSSNVIGKMNNLLSAPAEAPMEMTKDLGILLFTKNVFQFEILGVLLLVIAVGVVALARSKGGTHAQ